MVIFSVVILLILAFLIVGYSLAAKIIYPRTFPFQKTYIIEVEKGKLIEEEYNSWKKEEIQVVSPYGYKISATYFPIAGSNKTIILSHGVTYTRLGMVKYMPIFRKRGFNILIYDLRYHGKTGGPNCTFGFYEKNDLKILVDWWLERLNGVGIIGSMGESMGAAIALQHAALDPRLDFVISDCSFSTLQDQAAYRLQQDFHLPAAPFIQIGSIFCKLLTGMKISDIRPEKDVQKIKSPVLFIHSRPDTYIPPAMTEELYQNKKTGRKQLYLAPKGNHAEAYWCNRDEYDQCVGDFLNSVVD